MCNLLIFSTELIRYCGESPDECCLVGAAKNLGDYISLLVSSVV